MKRLFLFVLIMMAAALCMGEGPRFSHKDPITDREFENVYQDLRSLRSGALSSDDVILNQATLQSGATFYVSSGTARSFTAVTVNSASVTATSRLIVPTGSAAVPSITFSADTDTGFYNSNNAIHAVTSGGERTRFWNGGIWTQTGTQALPSYSFLDDIDTGMRQNGAGGSIVFTHSGDDKIAIDSTGNLFPADDNVRSSGANGARWTAVWAVDGTIETSNTRFKREIVSISTDTISVPRGIKFRWKSREGTAVDHPRFGFVADDLPDEAHPRLPDGTIDRDNVYTSAVIGILCQTVRDLQDRVSELESKAKSR